MALAPIIVFAYKRPEKLRETLRSLATNALASSSELFICCDGPKAKASEADRRDVAEVRAVAEAATGFLRVEVLASVENKGLARSVIEGVTAIMDRFGQVIVVEDDTLVSPHFLLFMNDALDLYADDDRVFAVGAWNYFADPEVVNGNFFLRYPDSQSWATWKRSWDRFEQDGRVLLDRLKERGLLQRLDGDGEVCDFSRMLRDQVAGRIDSWAIRWTANCILQEKVNFFPTRSLVRNMGIGAGATHESDGYDHNKDLPIADRPVAVTYVEPVESPEAFRSWVAYRRRLLGGAGRPSLKDRLWWLMPVALRRWYRRRKTAASRG